MTADILQGEHKSDTGGIKQLKERNVYASAFLSDSTCYNPCLGYGSLVKDKKFTGKTNHNWLKNGDNDNVPSILKILYQDSLSHSSILNTKIRMIQGGDVVWNASEVICKRNEDGFFEEIETKLSESQIVASKKAAQLWAKNIGLDNYKNKAASNTAIWGGYYGMREYQYGRNPITFKAEGSSSFLRRLYVEDFNLMRLGTEREWQNESHISSYHYIARDFGCISAVDMNRIVEYSNYDPFNNKIAYLPVDYGQVTREQGDGWYSKAVFNITPYRNYYPTAQYESRGALDAFSLDALLSRHKLNEVRNGFKLEYIVVINRKELLDEEKEKDLRRREIAELKGFKGVEGGSSMAVWANPTYDDNGKLVALPPREIIQIPKNNSVEVIKYLTESNDKSIFSAHTVVTSEIVGAPSIAKTGFSSQSEFLISALEQMHHNCIAPVQQMIQKDLGEIAINAGILLSPTIQKNTPSFNSLVSDLEKYVAILNSIDGFEFDAEQKQKAVNEVVKRLNQGLTNLK